MAKSILFENLIAESKTGRRRLRRIANFNAEQGEMHLFVGDDNIDLLRLNKHHQPHKLMGNATFNDDKNNSINLLKDKHNYVRFTEDSHIYDLSENRILLDYFLESKKKVELKFNNIITWYFLTKNHRKLFHKKHLLITHDLNKNLQLMNENYKRKNDEIFNGNLTRGDYANMIEIIHKERLNLIMILLDTIKKYWKFYERIRKSSTSNFLLVNDESIEELKKEVETRKFNAKINKLYLEKTTEISVLTQEMKARKTNFESERSRADFALKNLIKSLKNNKIVYTKLWRRNKRVSYLKLMHMYSLFSNLLNHEYRFIKYLNTIQIKDLSTNIYNYIFEFVNNNLYFVSRGDVTDKRIKKIIRDEFEFDMRPYHSISINNKRNYVNDQKESVNTIKRMKMRKVKKYDKKKDDNELLTLQFELEQKQKDFNWKKEYLKSQEDNSKEINEAEKTFNQQVALYKKNRHFQARYLRQQLNQNSEFKSWFASNPRALILKEYSNLTNTLFTLITVGKKLFKINSFFDLTNKRSRQFLLLKDLLLNINSIDIKLSDLVSTSREIDQVMKERFAFLDTALKNPFLIVSKSYAIQFSMQQQEALLNSIKKFVKSKDVAFTLVDKLTRGNRNIMDKVTISHDHKRIEVGEIHEVISNPIHPYTRFILLDKPVPNMTVQTKELSNEISFLHHFNEKHSVYATVDQFVNWSKIDIANVRNYVHKEIIFEKYEDGQKTQIIDMHNPDIIEETMIVDLSKA